MHKSCDNDLMKGYKAPTKHSAKVTNDPSDHNIGKKIVAESFAGDEIEADKYKAEIGDKAYK